MFKSVYDLKTFYGTRQGRLLRRLLLYRLRRFWPATSGLRLAGIGYAVPYLLRLSEHAERVAALMPATLGVHPWPERGSGLVGIMAEDAWPLETESVDRLLLIHSLEHALDPDALLTECWRVLKSQGRLLMVVPNRLGLWARADWTPFGHGRPFTAAQITHHLQESRFAVERAEQALFMPPFKSFGILRSAYLLEGVGQHLFPNFAGVHLIEASKQVYAGIRKPRAELVRQPLLAGATAPT